MKYIIASLALLTACGTDSSSNTSSRGESAPSGMVISSEEAEDSGSFYAATEADLPVCDKGTYGRLVYIGSTDSFKACQTGGYISVTIKGKDGKDGASATGAQALSDNEWVDPFDGKKWVFASPGIYANTSICAAGGYHMPTSTELISACMHGAFKVAAQKIGALSTAHAWHSISGGYVDSSACSTSTQSTSLPSQIFCVK